MSTSTSYKWVGPKQQRATKIPAAEWTKQEAKIRELHSRMTLLELMDVMKSEGFIATRTQYIYQFSKWGLQKYGTTKSANDDSTKLEAILEDPPVMPGEETVAVSPDRGRKRSFSTQDNESCDRVVLSSLLSARKRARVIDEDTVLRCEYANLLDLPRPDSPTLGPCLHDNEKDDGNAALACESESDADGLSFCGPAEDLYSPHVTASTNNSTEVSASQGVITHSNTFTETGDSIIWSKNPAFDPRSNLRAPASELSFQIQLDKAISMADYAKREMNRVVNTDQSVLELADYLFAVMNRQRSFAIYERLLEADFSLQHVLSGAALSCIRAAETPSQRDFARSLLLGRLKKMEEHAANHSERRLTHILLAEIFANDLDDVSTENSARQLSLHHLASAMKMTPENKTIDVSCDLLMYICSKQVKEDLYGARDRRTPVSYDDFIQFSMGLRSFTETNPIQTSEWQDYLHPGSALFDYVVSCFRWCAISVDVTSLYQPFDSTWLAEGSSQLPGESLWLETTTLYNHLYHKWRSTESEYPISVTHWLWMRGNRETLRISPAELLMVCCDMMTAAAYVQSDPLKTDNMDTMKPLVINLPRVISTIERLPRPNLVTRFLQRLFVRTKRSGRGADLAVLTKEENNILPIPESGSEIREIVTDIIPASWPLTPGYYDRSTSKGGLTREVEYDPTIASSCGSSNASYRRIRDAAASLLRGRFRATKSRSTLNSQATSMSLPGSIDTMSDIMRDSLSISDAPLQDHLLQKENESRLSQEVEDGN
ncbi:hypothetical protein PG996_004423 [Apiospora saccharicola]|uniref:Clr5 domain-containing protein n=1 Tax=Apiospora saccharicola TaxID=335842 RepID=A0ABR1W424_9PEZI